MTSMTTDYSVWPFTGRDDLVQRTLAAVKEDRGAVLLGGQGMGKTALAHQVLDTLRDDCHLIHLRGTAAYSGTPYGCLGVLISRQAPTVLDHPIAVLQSIIEHIAEVSQGRKTVLFVDNAQHLDPSSAMVVSQLAHYGSATVIAACNDLLAAPAEITKLWRDGLLRRIDIGPLSDAEAADVLEAGLGGRLSRWAATSLWQASGGNPLLLQGFARELVRSGQLQQQGGIWVRDGSSHHHSQAFMELISSRLGQLPPDEREALEIVSLSGAIDFDLLVEVVGGPAVDALQESGSIEVTFDRRPLVRMNNALAAEVIAEAVPAGRKLTLLERIESTGREPIQIEDNIRSITAWSLACGRAVDQAAVLRAARMANQRGEPHAAMQLLARLPKHHSSADAVIAESQAWFSLGDSKRTSHVLDEYETSAHAEPSLRQWAELALVRWALGYKETSGAGAAGALLQQVRYRLATAVDDDGSLAGGEGARLLEETELAELEMLAFHGHYDRILCQAPDGGSGPMRSASYRLVADGWRCEASALTGDHAASSALAVDLHERMDDAQPAAVDAAVVFQRLFTARFWSGDWNTDASMSKPGSPHCFYHGPGDELAEGVLQACRGRTGSALDLLVPAVAQARVYDPAGLLPLGLAAAGYAHALDGDIESANAILDDDALRERERLSWQLAQAVDYLVALATARRRRHHEPVAALLSSIGNQQPAFWSHELLLVSSVVRLGERTMADRLQATAGKCEGEFARLCSLFGQGIEAKDSGLLLQAAEAAEGAGNILFCYDAARQALSAATAARNVSRVRAAQELLARSRRLLGWRDGSVSAGRGLTAREREIALRAARGEPSRSIAKDLSVSVRTVEGHLHQVYGKLHVNSRVDLIDALA
ncbi:LuxR C-terminal-related transcriptional regulator [Arthrobacter pigmenti]